MTFDDRKAIHVAGNSGGSPTQFGRTAGLRRSCVTIGHFILMMKPRVMSLVMFTALVGLLIAPGPFDPSRDFIILLCIAAGAGGAAVLNMWYDADIDAVMTRTAMRPIPSGRVSRAEALIFGLILSSGGIGLLGFMSNKIAAALLAFTIFFYVAVYTIWLKRRTTQNIVIGGAAGALPPVIGWAASAGRIGIEPFVLFLIIFLWTPAHFWALSLNHAGEYARAGIPMLPVVAGRARTKKQILMYSILLVLVSTMPWVLGFAGAIYGAIAVVFGATMILLAVRLRGSAGDTETDAAGRLFAFSIVYLFILFASLLVDAAVTRGQPA
jgi:protoheme IX farnesyltransferase